MQKALNYYESGANSKVMKKTVAEFEKLEKLDELGHRERACDLAIELAESLPQDANAQIEAAFRCDNQDRESQALVYYERARELGVPADKSLAFQIGYGSTLRNVGRLAESIEILVGANNQFPEDFAVKVFLALSLHANGNYDSALATMMEVAIKVDNEGALGSYTRALAEYKEELSTKTAGAAPF